MRWLWSMVLFVACAHDHVLVATLDRGACNGTCPVYSVYIYDDGEVDYIGSQFVKVQGSAITRLNREQLSALDELFASYFTLGGSYEAAHAVDVPLISTSYARGGHTKEIRHAGSADIPAALTAIEVGIDKLVHIERWIGTRDERTRHDSYQR